MEQKLIDWIAANPRLQVSNINRCAFAHSLILVFDDIFARITDDHESGDLTLIQRARMQLDLLNRILPLVKIVLDTPELTAQYDMYYWVAKHELHENLEDVQFITSLLSE